MDARNFIYEISRLAPSAAQLEAVGLNKSEIKAFQESFSAREREERVDYEGDAVLQLLTHWDAGRIEVGMLRFSSCPEYFDGKYWIGCVEADPLYLVKATGEIVVEDLDASGHVLWFVAETGSALLDALVPVARFLAQRAIGELGFDDDEAAGAIAAECAALAGGDRFWKFYAMLLGTA